MKLIKPIHMSPEKLLSSTAVEEYLEWDSTTTYSQGNKVIYGESIYESLIDSNLDIVPTSSLESWLRVAPTNTFAMFDNSVSTQTTGATPLEVSISPNQVFNSLALLNMQATSVTVEVVNGLDAVYTNTVALDASTVIDWYMYFFEPITYRKDLVLTDIPPYATGVLNVTLEGGGDIKVGSLIFGNVYDIGDTQYGVGFGIRDYSVKQTDAFGNTIFVKRNFSKRMSPTVFVDNSSLTFIANLLTELRAEPTVFIGSDEGMFDSLIVYGYMRDWNIDISYPQNSLLRLEIEGLT